MEEISIAWMLTHAAASSPLNGSKLLAQVSEDAKNALIKDIEQSINLHINNTERSLEEKKHTAELIRKDRQAQLTEALKVAISSGFQRSSNDNGAATKAGYCSFIYGWFTAVCTSSKSLQAELDVLSSRKDDTPFIDGLRQTQAQLNLLKELNPKEKNFKIFHIDGEVLVPSSPSSLRNPFSQERDCFWFLSIGFLIALIRSGLLRELLSESRSATSYNAQ